MVRSPVDSQLHHLRAISEDYRLGHRAMTSIRGDVDRIIEVVSREHWPPGAAALFSRTGRQFFEEVSLPRGLRDRVVDETAWVRPMLAVLDEYHRCCVVVVDRETARAWELFRDEMRETGALSRSTDRGGNQAKIEELTKRHFRELATMVEKLYRDCGFDLLVVGGHRAEVPRFLDFLTHELRARLAAVQASASGGLAAVRHTPDVVDELVQVVIDESGSIEHVSADTALKDHVAAASLRFPLPLQP